MSVAAAPLAFPAGSVFCAGVTAAPYELVRLRNGAVCVRSMADAETFHPGIGPVAEAEALYVRQLQLPERVQATPGEFVLWDVGLGAAANALTALRSIGAAHLAGSARTVRLVSFDHTDAALRFALEHSAALGYLVGFEAQLMELAANGFVRFTHGGLNVEWQFVQGDFPGWLADDGRAAAVPPPHAILFDPHSPQKNPAMWTVPLFADLFRRLDPQRPCALANFTRSTLARAALLLGGFFVGVGHASGFKEETTVAANRREVLAEPLDQRWLERARRSSSAEPLWTPEYRRAPLSEGTGERLRRHPQFSGAESSFIAAPDRTILARDHAS